MNTRTAKPSSSLVPRYFSYWKRQKLRQSLGTRLAIKYMVNGCSMSLAGVQWPALMQAERCVGSILSSDLLLGI